MSQRPSALPSTAAISAALKKTTETLAAELAWPSGHAPDFDDLEWSLAKAVAAMHGVSSLLYGAVSWPGAPGWMEFLAEQRLHTTNRHLRIVELLERIDQRAGEDGIAAIALKGAALHGLGLYAKGERPMADIDLLVKPEDEARAVQLIEGLGYREYRANWKQRAFAPEGESSTGRLGEHSANMVKIELHVGIAERLPRHVTDITAVIASALRQPGLNVYPSKAALMLHLLLHATGDMAYKSLRLLQLHDLALLARSLSAADWEEFSAYRLKLPLWWAWPALDLMLRYYGPRVPGRILETLRADCPWHLRQVSRRRSLPDVSFSHLWVDAFPGMVWSRSLPDVLGYVVSRVRPDKEMVALRVALGESQPWASDREWSQRSQTRRIMIWLTSRPTRPATMHAVNAVLGAPHE